MKPAAISMDHERALLDAGARSRKPRPSRLGRRRRRSAEERPHRLQATSEDGLGAANGNRTGIVPLARKYGAEGYGGRLVSSDGRLDRVQQEGRGDADVDVIRPDRSGQRQITFSRGNDIDPSWSRGGARNYSAPIGTGTIDI